MQDKLALYNAYSAAKQTVSKTRQVVMLYDGIMNYMRQAKSAIVEKRYEDRYNLLAKASDIVFAMRGALDFERGGKVAHVLDGFYSSLDLRLMALNRSNDADDCESILGEIKEMRDAWDAIDKKGGDSNENAAALTKLDEAKPVQPAEGDVPTPMNQGLHISV